MTVALMMRLPGEIETTTGDRGDDGITWSAPMDGSSADLATRAVLRAGGSGSGWAGPVSTIALVLLGAWLVAGILLAVLVVRARSRRRNRPLRRLH